MEYQELYEDVLDETAMEATNGDVRFTCPYCGSTKRKFYVHTDTGVYTCYNCEEVGNVITFLKTYYEYNYHEVLEFLSDWGYEQETTILSQDKTLIEALLELKIEEAQKEDDSRNYKKHRTFPKMPTNSFPIKTAPFNVIKPYYDYLVTRGINIKQIAYYNIYYCEEGSLTSKEGKEIPIKKSVIFITFNKEGKAIYWNTRSIEQNPYIKSINAPNLEPTDYSRREVVFNLNTLGNRKDIVICEGVFNAITVDTSKYCGVATFGKKVTDNQIDDLYQANKQSRQPINYYVFLDNDAPNAILSVAQRLVERGIPTEQVKVVNNPYQGKDANDLGREFSKQLVEQAQPFNLLTQLTLTQQIQTN